MKARELLSTAAFGPQTLKVIFQAFDDAWAKIAPSVGTDPKAVEAMRIRLAEVILSFAHSGSDDPKQLSDLALNVLQQSTCRPRR